MSQSDKKSGSGAAAESAGSPIEPWAAWMDAMRTWFAHPNHVNPFPGSPGGASGSAAAQVSEWMKLIDPETITRRLDELRVVEAWMRMSLSGIETTIRTLEMQRDAYASLAKGREAAQAAQAAMRSAVETAAQSMADAVASATAATRARRPAPEGSAAGAARSSGRTLKKAARRNRSA
ncbi:MAG: PhaM family polyhydroxyalkanoate granule multifunctional regulatory protein [Casimicrobiaceae bacterium]